MIEQYQLGLIWVNRSFLAMAGRAKSIKRRKVLSGLAATTAAGLAGCNILGNGNGDGDGDFGERVPDISVSYQADRGIYTSTAVASRGPFLEALNAIGMDGEYQAIAFADQSRHWTQDTRTFDVISNFHGNDPARLDPHELIRRWSVDWAGGDGNSNINNYANCEYSTRAIDQASAPTEADRERLVHEAIEIFNQDYAAIPYLHNVIFTAAREDEVDVAGTGSGVFTQLNPPAFIKSTPTNGDSYVCSVDPTTVEVSNPYTISSSTIITFWTGMPHSKLLEYDENFELQPVLAEDYEVEDDATTFRFHLRDATFHNGDEITAEDVQFTFEHISKNAGSYPQAESVPYESIDVVDDKTVEFHTETSFLPLVGRVVPKWGIMHKASWEEFDDNPEDMDFFEDPIGSGPYEVVQLQRGQFLELTPHDGHPIYSADHDLVFQAFGDQNAIYNAFEANEIQVATALSLDFVNRIRDNVPDGEIYPLQAFTPYTVYPQFPSVPMKFKAIRQAWGTAVNRQQINELAYGGENEIHMHAHPFTTAHPWLPDDVTTFTDDPTGEPERAREVLEEAGFGWDDDDNLRYPPDADMEPLWPAEEVPCVDDFPCLEDIGREEHQNC